MPIRLWTYVLKTVLIFIVLSAATIILSNMFEVKFGSADFWNHHGIFFLIFIALFPRLTLLLSSVASGGFIWWVGWIFAPRILVAMLATLAYWNANPLLVVFAWLVAIGGETSEKVIFVKRSYNRPSYRQSMNMGHEVIDIKPNR